MEVDELEGGFLQQFSNMQTIDREDLVKQMLKLVGANLNSSSARFYLEMNQWNVQAAICSYFDLERMDSAIPGMVLVRDVTVGEGESVAPGSSFVKTWRVQNPGPDRWPPGCILRYTSGTQMSNQERVLVGPLDPYMSTDISVDMTSPSEPGIYQSKWRMSTATGNFFGDTIWVIINVEPAGTLGITQQFSKMDELGSPVKEATHRNPFGSPGRVMGPLPPPPAAAGQPPAASPGPVPWGQQQPRTADTPPHHQDPDEHMS